MGIYKYLEYGVFCSSEYKKCKSEFRTGYYDGIYDRKDLKKLLDEKGWLVNGVQTICPDCKNKNKGE